MIQTFPLLTSKTLDLHANTAISIGIKQQTLELILSVIERVPKSLSLSQHTLEGLFQMVFLHLMSLEEIDFNDSFSEETDAEFENVRFGREAIDRIMGSLGGKPILEIFSIYIQKLLQMKDWKFTFSALMGLSQVGEYLEEINEIEGSIELILNYSNHPHPMIRYAVCHTLGQLSSDMKPEFQMKYHQRILPLLINILEDDSVLVQCHGAAALSNFIDGMNLQPLFEYLNTIVPKLLKYIKGSTGKLKEQLINALSNTSKIARDTFIPYMKESLDLLISIIKNTIQDNFKVLRGVILATITQIAASVGFEQFHDYIEDLFSFLRAVPPANLFEVHEIVIAWKRTLIFLPPEQLIHYMNEKIWNDIIAMPELCQENPQDFEETLRLLQIFLEKVPLNYLTPYFEKISNLLIPLTSSGNLNPIRIISLKGLPFLLNILKLGNKKKQEDLLIKGFLDLILKMNDEKIDLEVRSQLMRTLLCLINEKNENNLDKLDFEQVLRLIWGNIEKSMGKKIQLDRKKNENYEEDEEDEDMEELLNEDIKEENEFLILMGELLAAIFRKFQEFLIDFKVIDTFLLDLAPKAIDLGLYKFILYTLDDMMDEINLLDLLIPHRTSIFTLLMNSIEDLNCEIRQASLYGIGVFVEKFKMLDFLDMTVIENIRVKIIEAIKMKKNKESNNTYGLCKDNAISALGKLFRAHHDKINLKQTIQIWLEALPIKYDVKEALIQYDLLFNALNSDPNIIIMDSSDNLEKIFKIIGEIYGTHLINEEIREQILKFVMNIMNLKNYDFEKFGTRLKEMNPSALKRLEQCFQDVKQMK